VGAIASDRGPLGLACIRAYSGVPERLLALSGRKVPTGPF